MEKRIIQHSKLEEIKDPQVHKTWGRNPEFMFYYMNRQVAKVSLVEVSLIVTVHVAFAPWTYVSNDKRQFFANMSIVEDQCHGTNIIDVSNLQALYMEYHVNNRPPADKAQEFADLLRYEMEQAAKQMKNSMANQTMKDLVNQHRTFPMWTTKTTTIKTIK